MTMLRCLLNKPTVMLAQVLLGLFFVGLSHTVYALGLGNIRILSALDEPLLAEIELTSPKPADMESLQVKLGSVEDFQRAGVSRSEHVLGMAFELATRDDGKPIIRVSTEESTREPFLHFLVAAEWSGGRLLREYTALLDPPKYAAEAPAPVRSPRTAADAAGPSAEAPAPVEPAMAPPVSAPAGAEPAPASRAPTLAATDGGRDAQYGPTRATPCGTSHRRWIPVIPMSAFTRSCWRCCARTRTPSSI
jgi:pilus assembly protein FimV